MAELTLSRIDRIEVEYDVTVVLTDGQTAEVTSLDFALVPPSYKVTPDTNWTAFPVVGGVATVTYAAFAAGNLSSALVVPLGGADVHAREVDGLLIKAVLVERINVS